jgi:hypothetical protein
MDGQYIASGSSDKTINIIYLKSKVLYHKFDKIHTGNIILLLILTSSLFLGLNLNAKINFIFAFFISQYDIHINK